jgi:hypothetical protein
MKRTNCIKSRAVVISVLFAQWSVRNVRETRCKNGFVRSKQRFLWKSRGYTFVEKYERRNFDAPRISLAVLLLMDEVRTHYSDFSKISV